MRKEEQKLLIKVTNLNESPENENWIEIILNWKFVYLIPNDDKILSIKDKLTNDDIAELQKYIFEYKDSLYYPNLKNDLLLKERGEFHFLNKDVFLMTLPFIVETNWIYTDSDLESFNQTIEKLSDSHLSIYYWYKYQQIFQILMFTHYFYWNSSQEEYTTALASVLTANNYSKNNGDTDLIDLQYVMYCANKKNYTHIWDHLKKESKKILEEVAKELAE